MWILTILMNCILLREFFLSINNHEIVVRILAGARDIYISPNFQKDMQPTQIPFQ
jgi:hypothetical protein